MLSIDRYDETRPIFYLLIEKAIFVKLKIASNKAPIKTSYNLNINYE